MIKKLNPVEKIVLFNQIGGTLPEFDKRKASLYVGLIAEEFTELIESFDLSTLTDTERDGWINCIEYLNEISNRFKSGGYDYLMDNVNRVEFLDACVDISVVSIGGGIAIGSDIHGALNEVADNNLSKFNKTDDGYEVLFDENGKIKKPANYQKVSLDRFLK